MEKFLDQNLLEKVYIWKHQRTNHYRSIQKLMQLNYEMKTK